MKNVKKTCDILIILLIAYGAWSFLGCIFRCFPLRSLWDDKVQADICIDMRLLHYSCYAINLVMVGRPIGSVYFLLQAVLKLFQGYRNIYHADPAGSITTYTTTTKKDPTRCFYLWSLVSPQIWTYQRL
jgi:hypothetical protein